MQFWQVKKLNGKVCAPPSRFYASTDHSSSRSTSMVSAAALPGAMAIERACMHSCYQDTSASSTLPRSWCFVR